ncbi:two-component sensor histidine kinase [Bifidobacterium pullorum subsp. gallinarum]|uniref:Sensor-like histidine kinase SenX3 n=1 Tax=Bifidobacterium pullorum subsp. gallinarum TaxID=78344 RepID=A0A4P6DUZ7_9BIFI|nr:ATP-binding protein [Bifidobacterium pullorum]QAY33566.1 two-component sensor histidine kinase [Bifidobacterium pullorum subsp. gallinarum]
MEIWQVVVLVVAVAAAAAIGAAVAYGRGREAGESESRHRSAEGDHSLFGEDLPVLPTERRFVEVMPYALIVADSAGAVAYASKGADPLNLVRNGRLVAEDIGEVLALVVADGQVRERELKVTLPRPDRRQDGRGVRAGEAVPTDTLYLRVRIGAIADDLFAIFLRDMSEQRRFEAMRRDFITNVSHELKTPSGAISLLAETITDAADDPDAVRYFAGRITKESQRLAELVYKLIELQRAQDAPAVSDAKPMSVVAMTRESIAANEVQADAKRIGIVLSLNGRVIPVEVPEGESETLDDDVLVRVGREPFTTAVKNLVENAVHYSPAHTTVSVGIGVVGDRVRIRVVDQGIGIPKESLGRIFERFYRVDPARSRETGGSGLGLAITKHCVQECGGTISVWSREGEGSTFTIELPVA